MGIYNWGTSSHSTIFFSDNQGDRRWRRTGPSSISVDFPFSYIKASILFADTQWEQQLVIIESGDEMTDAETVEQPGSNPKALKNS